VWVDSHRREFGYEVRLPDVNGIRIGWLTHDRPFTFPWRGWCAIATCKELGGTTTRDNAAYLTRKHWQETHG